MYTSIIILNYNNAKDTISCIESIEKYNTAEIKYIIVDNGSNRVGVTDTIDDYLKSRYSGSYNLLKEGDSYDKNLSRFTFYLSEKNEGYAKGNNKGLELAYSDDSIDDVLILNNDILFVEDIIPKLKKARLELSDCAIVSPVLFKKKLEEIDYNCARKNHKVWSIILTFLFLYRDIFGVISKSEKEQFILKKNDSNVNHGTIEVELPSGSCMMIKKSLFKDIKGFDPNTFLYYEENILYKKLNRKGYKNYVDCGSKCIHLGASTTKTEVNTFILKCSLNSASYYLSEYCQLNIIQKSVWKFARILFLLKIKIIEKLNFKH